jgi:hypothetical protein
MVMVLAGSAARAAPMDVDTCHSIKLPAPISDTIANQFSGWQVVTSADLVDPGDRAFWKENLPKECPGIIAGRFRTRQLDYAISLIKRNVDSSEQQILVFEAEKVGFKILVLEHPTRVGVILVLRKFGPGIYTSPDTRRSLRIRRDTIGVSQIEASTVVFYWSSGRFKRIETSE